MGADYSFYVKTIETHARAFIIFSIGSVALVILLCANFSTGKEDFKLWTFRGYNEEDGYLKGQTRFNS